MKETKKLTEDLRDIVATSHAMLTAPHIVKVCVVWSPCNTPPAPQKYIENGLSVCVGKGTVLFITGALNAMTAVCY